MKKSLQGAKMLKIALTLAAFCFSLPAFAEEFSVKCHRGAGSAFAGESVFVFNLAKGTVRYDTNDVDVIGRIDQTIIEWKNRTTDDISFLRTINMSDDDIMLKLKSQPSLTEDIKALQDGGKLTNTQILNSYIEYKKTYPEASPTPHSIDYTFNRATLSAVASGAGITVIFDDCRVFRPQF